MYQICSKVGHLAVDCYHRMDHAYQGCHPPQRLAAHQPNHDNTWYLTPERRITLPLTWVISPFMYHITGQTMCMWETVKVCPFPILAIPPCTHTPPPCISKIFSIALKPLLIYYLFKYFPKTTSAIFTLMIMVFL